MGIVLLIAVFSLTAVIANAFCGGQFQNHMDSDHHHAHASDVSPVDHPSHGHHAHDGTSFPSSSDQPSCCSQHIKTDVVTLSSVPQFGPKKIAQDIAPFPVLALFIAHLNDVSNKTYVHYGTHPPITSSAPSLFIQIRNIRI